ncbi:MAG TPA: pyruvate:ferredoxin (flavodoxin) oxidoreductase [Aggregatilinea sp.]|uniref:pyruvate:ferredoxin (flavodoxin) oxidoreductase n=1 Tax=Aggregatilinea sp. TaxID=2806333 RepID=UPI002CE4A5F0|nr:pyruvate:ferredoxin (flavodoxin) oxidoreductase [Aggregatilinea sp.]HML22747.1 pyruvate:ferredoxin (flavodoxin) oxidoreductase [Aggregatilinea sp.]
MSQNESSRKLVTIDGNTAAAQVAHALSEVIAIYPITPSSPMGELADELSAAGETNIWGTIPLVAEMQSEGGASGAVHGALTTGALTTTFTASQGLLLMIPNMYKIAGELTSAVFHVAARALAAQALSIFGDHSDINAARATGFAFLCSGSVQESMDLALIAHAATLEARIPFVHFFDGFRTSHEVQKIEQLTKEDLRAMIDEDLVIAHRLRGLSPDRPVVRGTSQNPDVYFQGRESVNKYYEDTPAIVQKAMDHFAEIVGRQYHLFDYEGAPDANRVVIMMGSGAETTHEVVDYLNAQGEKVGLIKVRLYRPFDASALIKALPGTVKAIAVLDRTKEPGSQGEPLYLDVVGAINEAVANGDMASHPIIVGGRYGLGSKEYDPGMAKSVFDNLAAAKPKNHFTVGIIDDVTETSLPWDADFSTEANSVHRAMFFGLGSDGTVGANKNSIKIIGKATDYYAQGYFVYDSKKSGARTVSHLRFSKKPIHSTYLIKQAQFVACHQFSFIDRYSEVLDAVIPGGTFLLSCPYDASEIFQHLPIEVQQKIIDKKLKFYVINADELAKEVGLGRRVNIIMQTAFFLISGVLPEEKAMEMIEMAVEDTYGRKGGIVVEMNINAAHQTSSRIQQVAVPAQVIEPAPAEAHMRPPVPANAPDFVKAITGEIIAGRGDLLPVSAIPADGTFPTGTTKYEKRNIATDIPVWEPEICIQCNQCSLVCPHGVIRIKVYPAQYANGSSPEGFKSMEAKGKQWADMRYTLQISPEDCTGCDACVEICPAIGKDAQGNKTPDHKAINMEPLTESLRLQEVANWEYFETLPDTDPATFNRFTVKGSQFLPPMFEFSGACAGCGETPVIKLMSQLYGDRAIIANATGCSSIYGGNLPTTPYTTRKDGRGPAWSNSLFEDAAEFGMGMRLTVDKLTEFAQEKLAQLIAQATSNVELLAAVRDADQSTQEGIEAQRERVAQLKDLLAQDGGELAKTLATVADYLVKKSVWIFGGDGWGYDIGYGGLDHVLASGKNVNVLLLDTGVYSNTGGQMSKATPRAAVAKFAAAGKDMPKKDLGMIAMTYGNIYVAQIAMGANMNQAVKAFQEAEEYDGPSIIIAYTHCIAHGYDLRYGNDLQKDAVACGFWPLYRYNPMLAQQGKTPLVLDCKAPTEDIEKFMYRQNRFKILRSADPARAENLLNAARDDVATRWKMYEQMAALDI